MNNRKRLKELETLIATAQESHNELYRSYPSKRKDKRLRQWDRVIHEYKREYKTLAGMTYEERIQQVIQIMRDGDSGAVA